MNKRTNSVVFYIIMFFLGSIVLISGFFAYKIFLAPEKKIDSTSFKDEEFNEIIKKKQEEAEKRKNEKPVEYAQYDNPPCVVGDDVYEHGSIKDFFSRPGVGVYESCSDFSEQKKCDNGFWLGNPKFSFSTCQRSVDCKLNEDTLIADGESMELYSRDTVPYGSSCEQYKGIRICRETILTGNDAYKYKTCSVSNKGICKIPDGKGGENILADGRSHVFYSKEVVGYDQLCSDYSQNRLCSKGILYGDSSFSQWSCSKKDAANCVIDGIEIAHGTSQTLYSKKQAVGGKTCKFFAQIRSCSNGQLAGQEEYSYSSCAE